DISGVIGKCVFAVCPRVAFIGNIAAGRIHRNFRAAYGSEPHVTVGRNNVDAPAGDVRELNGATHALDLYVGIIDVVHRNVGSITFQSDVALHLFCLNRSGGGAYHDAYFRGNQDVITNQAFLVVGFLQEMSAGFNAVAGLRAIDFDLVRMNGGHDDYL